MSAPERIWLQAAEDAEHQCEGRLWCEDKVWPENDEQHEPTEFVRADIAASQLAKKQEQLDELPSPALWDESRKALASMRNEVGELRQQLAEARAKIDVQRESKEYAQRCCEAAEAERDRLAADNARLREVLAKVRDVQFPGWEAQTAVDYCRGVARAALAGKE